MIQATRLGKYQALTFSDWRDVSRPICGMKKRPMIHKYVYLLVYILPYRYLFIFPQLSSAFLDTSKLPASSAEYVRVQAVCAQ